MTTNSLNPPRPLAQDPDLGMGQTLMAIERRQRLLKVAQVVAVWVVLIAFLIVLLVNLNVNPDKVWNSAPQVLQGVGYTLLVSLASIFFASILALFGALGRLSNNVIAQGISSFYITVVRGTPLLIQIYIIYLGLPRIGAALSAKGFDFIGDLLILQAIPSGILALSLNYGAYMTEIFRAGLLSVGHGQWEAASVLGMTRWQVLRRIVLPQAVRIIIPDVGNQFISMQKDSSLVSIMGVWEVTFLANQVAKRENEYMGMFLVAASVYLVLTVVSSWLQSRLEQRMAHAYER
jgi:polar amino acid transport system permease protein